MNSVDSKKSSNKLIISVLCGITFCFVAFFCGRCSVKPQIIEGETKRDTTYITKTDTFLVVKDSIRYKTKLRLDTVYIHDTVLIREQKEYEDSVSRIWVSGIDPEIDSIRYTIPYREIIIESEVTKVERVRSGWAFTVGIYAGGGAAVRDGVVYLSPEIGIGGSIGWSWIIERKKR